jgi:hypothetical protein
MKDLREQAILEVVQMEKFKELNNIKLILIKEIYLIQMEIEA